MSNSYEHCKDHSNEPCVWHHMGRYYIRRERYFEMIQIAKEMVEFLESRGVQPGEYCFINVLADSVWRTTKVELKP